MANNAIVAQDNLNKFIKFLDQTAGRDKIARLFQYSSRFLSWWLLNNQRTDLAKRFSALETHSSLARKLFRLAKSISYLQAAIKSFAQESDFIVRSTTVIQNLGLAIWLYYDHIIWAAKIGLVQKDTTEHARRANIFWLLAMVMGIVKSAYLLHITQQLAAQQQKPETLEALRKRQHDYILELLRNLFDIPIPLTGLNKTVAAHIPTGIVGICGTITSLIGMQQVWSKIK